MTSVSSGAEARLCAAASPANRAPPVTTGGRSALESDLGFIDRSSIDQRSEPLFMSCAPVQPVTGSKVPDAAGTPSSAQGAFGHTAPFDMGRVRFPVFKRVDVRTTSLSVGPMNDLAVA